MDREGKVGKIVTHCFKISCDPKPSMIVINTKEKKIILERPNGIQEISLVPVQEEDEEDQCKQKLFYDKKNLPVWDRWGKDALKIGVDLLKVNIHAK